MVKRWAVVIGILGCLSAVGCSDDKEEESVTPGVAAACQQACQRVAGADCPLSSCLDQCKAMEKEAPRCAAQLQVSLECTANASTLVCNGGDLGDDECDYGDWLRCTGRLP